MYSEPASLVTTAPETAVKTTSPTAVCLTARLSSHRHKLIGGRDFNSRRSRKRVIDSSATFAFAVAVGTAPVSASSAAAPAFEAAFTSVSDSSSIDLTSVPASVTEAFDLAPRRLDQAIPTRVPNCPAGDSRCQELQQCPRHHRQRHLSSPPACMSTMTPPNMTVSNPAPPPSIRSPVVSTRVPSWLEFGKSAMIVPHSRYSKLTSSADKLDASVLARIKMLLMARRFRLAAFEPTTTNNF